jgi:hypothetical protein
VGWAGDCGVEHGLGSDGTGLVWASLLLFYSFLLSFLHFILALSFFFISGSARGREQLGTPASVMGAATVEKS